MPVAPAPFEAPPPHARPTASAELAARLLRHFDAAGAEGTGRAMAALRASVTALVDDLKARGMPLERVVDVVETLLRDHGVARPGPALHVGEAPSGAWSPASVPARVLGWAARAYRDDDWW